MVRTALFQLHWLLGITAGIVLAIMGVTGATLSFEHEILAALNPGIATVEPRSDRLLSAPEIEQRLRTARPRAELSRIIVHEDRRKAAWVGFRVGKDREASFVDPYNGRLLGAGRGEGFFETMTLLHRFLALPGAGSGWGRQITGFSAVALIFFALSGLYLRWPKRPLDWRNWFVLDLSKTGRNLYRALHAVIGGWVLIFYLLSATTGLWWSYDWYRTGAKALLSSEAQERRKPKHDDAEGGFAFARAWATFEREKGSGNYESVTATIRRAPEVQFQAKIPGGRHDRVSDEMTVDGRDGRVISSKAYADRKPGDDLLSSVYELHRGAYFGMIGRIGVMIASLTMPLFTITGFLLYFARRRRKRALAKVPAAAPVVGGVGTLVGFASQTGSAERLARLTAAALPDAAAVPLAAIDDALLDRADRLLIVASTYGEGEPPDSARAFVRRQMGGAAKLDLDYAVLALGDREYDEFCAFGHAIDHWLHDSGGRRLFDLIEMDGDDPDAQRHWQQQLAGLGGRSDQPDWAPAEMQSWRLVERRLLNPGSVGGPVYHVALEAEGVRADWMPGDIVEILPRHDPRRVAAFAARAGIELSDDTASWLATRILPDAVSDPLDLSALLPLAHREYSVASIASSNRIELVVRQCMAEDGLFGLGSGWLTAIAAVGETMDARLRSNPGFHPPADPATPLILIGNGTGIAGLLAHLRHREHMGEGPAWLMLGERQSAHDALHDETLMALTATGVLTRLDRAWSREAAPARYVQDLIDANGDAVADWVARGAAIYVCGSVNGMAPGVHQALSRVLGEDALEAMMEDGRYRRDVY